MKPYLKTALAACVALTMLTSPVQALIVYTPLQTTVSDSGYILIDLNRDGRPEFKVYLNSTRDRRTLCNGFFPIWSVAVGIEPLTVGDGVVVSSHQQAQLLAAGQQVSGGSNFEYNTSENIFYYHGCPVARDIPGYLGLALPLRDGQHYAWVYVHVSLYYSEHAQVTVTGYAYETIPGMSIVTGQLAGM